LCPQSAASPAAGSQHPDARTPTDLFLPDRTH